METRKSPSPLLYAGLHLPCYPVSLLESCPVLSLLPRLSSVAGNPSSAEACNPKVVERTTLACEPYFHPFSPSFCASVFFCPFCPFFSSSETSCHAPKSTSLVPSPFTFNLCSQIEGTVGKRVPPQTYNPFSAPPFPEKKKPKYAQENPGDKTRYMGPFAISALLTGVRVLVSAVHLSQT